MKELDLGNSDFKSLIENDNYFVDKSLLIKEVIKAQKQVILLPRPRRFGKTLNLSMLKYYFEINQPENEKLFKNLKIWQTENDIKEKRGKFPVIYISFKNAKKLTWANTAKHIYAEIINLYKQHLYLLNDNILSDFEKIEFNDILYKRADEVTYENSIKQLSEYLHRFYKEKVVILIDEYDTPIQAGYKDFYNDAISFMRNLMTGAYKDNIYLYKGLITGILRVSKESIFTGLNNVSVYSILDDEFSDKFGFTEIETMQILSDFNVTTEYELIKKWYDGYKIGNTHDIYNPWSILNYAISFKSGFKTFWANTSSDDLIKEQLKKKDANYLREQLLKLTNNETIVKEIDENFVFPDLDTDKELLWTLLTFSGYLTSKNKTGRKSYELCIPNYEIKTVFQDIILKWLSTDIKIKRNTLMDTTNYLINNELVKFEKGFKEIIGDTFSYFDTKGEPENVYQSYVLGLLAIIGDDYIIKSNRESGEGRYDIMLIPHDKSKYGIVIEIKQIARIGFENEQSYRDRIDKKIREAKAQISKNQYYKELVVNKIPNIIKLPIVFAGKVPYIIPQKPE
ncbi:MAG: AAA family ATPase [Mariniphaga sp.]